MNCFLVHFETKATIRPKKKNGPKRACKGYQGATTRWPRWPEEAHQSLCGPQGPRACARLRFAFFTICSPLALLIQGISYNSIIPVEGTRKHITLQENRLSYCYLKQRWFKPNSITSGIAGESEHARTNPRMTSDKSDLTYSVGFSTDPL